MVYSHNKIGGNFQNLKGHHTIIVAIPRTGKGLNPLHCYIFFGSKPTLLPDYLVTRLICILAKFKLHGKANVAKCVRQIN